MSTIEAEWVEEPDGITDRQRALVDAYFACNFNKTEAFRRAGYTCSNPEKLSQRVNVAFKAVNVQREIARRQQENRVMATHEMTPLAVMIDNMNHWYKIATDPEKVTTAEAAAARAAAQECAKDAAPYMHPKLQAIAVHGRFDFTNLNGEQADAALSELRRSLEKDGVQFDDHGNIKVDGTQSGSQSILHGEVLPARTRDGKNSVKRRVP